MWDKLLRAAFVALAVALGWGIRGDFGHLIGAMYPGAALGLAFAFVSGQESLFRWMPILAAVSGLGIATGGQMSYGILHGYAQSDTFLDYAYGFFTLFLQGGAWGVFGCATVGLLLEQERVKPREWLAAAATVLVSGCLLYFLVVQVFGFHINPPRSDASIGFTGGAIGLFTWLALKKKPLGLRAAILGYVGFGMGMSVGRLLGNIANNAQTLAWHLADGASIGPFSINHWNVMEVSVGLIGGFVFAYGMLGLRYPAPSEHRGSPALTVCGAAIVLGVIPLLHRVTRIDAQKKLSEWAASLQTYGYHNPEALSKGILYALNVVCLLGFAGAAIWLYLHFRGKGRWAWFPVIWLSATMLLFQNLNALYFFYPRRPNLINMHFVFWVLFGLMVLYVAVQAVLRGPRDVADGGAAAGPFHWRRWVVGALASYVIVVLLAGFVNGEQTMKSANTRWPVWSWRDGPPSGTRAQDQKGG